MPKHNRARRRLLFKMSLLTCSTVIAVLLAEIVAALVVPSTIVRKDLLGRTNKTPGWRTESRSDGDDFYWDFLPNQQGSSRLLSHEYAWKINEHGLRNELLAEKLPDEFRILCLGDSQTFGLRVNQDETFSAQLERYLTNKTGRTIRVINAGVPGYGTFEALWKLKRIVSIVQPDLVIAVCYIDNVLVSDAGNDLWNNFVRIREHESANDNPAGGQKQKYQPQAKAKSDFLTNHSHLFNLIATAKQILTGQSHMSRVKRYRESKSTDSELLRVWDKTRELLLEMEEVSREFVGARTLLVYLPGIPSLIIGDPSARVELEKTQIPVISIYETFEGGKRKEYMHLRFRHDGHYNAHAHGLIAKEIGNYCLSYGFLQIASPNIPGQ